MAIPTNKLQYVAFSSNFRYEYIDLKGHVTTADTVTITHNLGYIPFYRLWVLYPDGTYCEASDFDVTGYITPSVTFNEFSVTAAPTTTTLPISVTDNVGVGGRSVTVYYRIYAEPQTA